MIEACLQSQSEKKAWSFIHQLLAVPLDDIDNQEVWLVAKEGGVNIGTLKEALQTTDDVIGDYITFADRVLSLSPGATAILSNGKVSFITILHYLIIQYTLHVSQHTSWWGHLLTLCYISTHQLVGPLTDHETCILYLNTLASGAID